MRKNEFIKDVKRCKQIALIFDNKTIQQAIEVAVKKYKSYCSFSGMDDGVDQRLLNSLASRSTISEDSYGFFINFINASIAGNRILEDQAMNSALTGMKYDFFSYLMLSNQDIHEQLDIEFHALEGVPYRLPKIYAFYSKSNVSLSYFNDETGTYEIGVSDDCLPFAPVLTEDGISLFQACENAIRRFSSDELLLMFSTYESAFSSNTLNPKIWDSERFKLTKKLMLDTLEKLQLQRDDFIERSIAELTAFFQKNNIPDTNQKAIVSDYLIFLRETQAHYIKKDTAIRSLSAQDRRAWLDEYYRFRNKLEQNIKETLRSTPISEILATMFYVVIASTLVTMFMCGVSLGIGLCTLNTLSVLLSQPMTYLNWALLTTSVSAIQVHGVFSKNVKLADQTHDPIVKKVYQDIKVLERIETLSTTLSRI